MGDKVTLTDVTLREYGQNVPLSHLHIFTPEIRIEIARELIRAGFRRMEVLSCVHPRMAPAMNQEDIRKIVSGLSEAEDVELVTLVPNEEGYRNFLRLGLGPEGYHHTVGVFFSAVEAHNRLNLGRSIREAMEEYEGIIEDAVARKLRVAGYVSAAFGYLDPDTSELIRPSPELLNRFIDFYFGLGVEVVTLSDLQGVADEDETARLLGTLLDGRKSDAPGKIGYHPHHVSGEKAVANSRAAFGAGIRHFDASLGGTGGCVTGAPGNQPAELLLRLFEGLGVETGVSIEKVTALEEFVRSRLYSRISRPLHAAP